MGFISSASGEGESALAEKCLENGYVLGVRGIVQGGMTGVEGESGELAPSRAVLLALGLMVRNSICPSPLGLIMPASWLGVLEGLVLDPEGKLPLTPLSPSQKSQGGGSPSLCSGSKAVITARDSTGTSKGSPPSTNIMCSRAAPFRRIWWETFWGTRSIAACSEA